GQTRADGEGQRGYGGLDHAALTPQCLGQLGADQRLDRVFRDPGGVCLAALSGRGSGLLGGPILLSHAAPGPVSTCLARLRTVVHPRLGQSSPAVSGNVASHASLLSGFLRLRCNFFPTSSFPGPGEQLSDKNGLSFRTLVPPPVREGARMQLSTPSNPDHLAFATAVDRAVSSPKTSHVWSPYSVASVLALLATGARERTLEQLLRLLGPHPKDQLDVLDTAVTPEEGLDLAVLNGLYLRKED